ncbi:hypothetical protein SAMN05216559_1278 [Halomicrobium zhouii]|uniref:Uncharacterized protein n=1 Tax=Halomicrobium zhouii TaxID=767519 RepID=A0A1I6KQ76_9EURY|nr:hypothetical protein [Halomicrobium zhouii]SFR93354.1 hypothetical protein SAMN05216559_1278 [Halomicrobium zhouii]
METPEFASLAVVGAVLPVASIAAVGGATVTYGLHWAVPLFLLLVSPLSAAVGLYGYGVRTGSLRAPKWVSVGTPPTEGDRIPDRYREAFRAETLAEPAVDEDAGPSGRLLALALVYLVSTPVYTLLFWGLFG